VRLRAHELSNRVIVATGPTQMAGRSHSDGIVARGDQPLGDAFVQLRRTGGATSEYAAARRSA
jgi:hypothetical protein